MGRETRTNPLLPHLVTTRPGNQDVEDTDPNRLPKDNTRTDRLYPLSTFDPWFTVNLMTVLRPFRDLRRRPNRRTDGS